MTILALSDIHGARAAAGIMLRRIPEFDVLVMAGDLTTRGSSADAAELLALLADSGKPVVSVAGNMDSRALAPEFARRSSYVEGRGFLIGDVGFFGVSGSPPTPFGTLFEREEEEILAAAEAGWKDVAGARVRVFVPHAPPYRTVCDRTRMGLHVGSRAVRTFVEQHQPEVVICGHIHESRGTDLIGTSRIVNPGSVGSDGTAAVIRIDTDVDIELV